MTKKPIPPLKSYDDIFGAKNDDIRDLPIAALLPFHDHPYHVNDDCAEMQNLVESIISSGVLVPALVRPAQENGKYEIVSGHRRRRACELAGLATMPVIVRDIDDDTATIMMVDANLQRENVLPSEKAFAYKMKMDAMKRQGYRSDLTSRQKVEKSETADIVAENECGRQVQRYIRLTYLIDPILKMVDGNKLALNSAVELSFLPRNEQQLVYESMDAYQTVPSLAQTKAMKKASHAGGLSDVKINDILCKEKKDTSALSIPGKVIADCFPPTYTPRQQQEIVILLLKNWARRQAKEG